MKQITLLIVLIALFSCQKQKTEVIICGTIHGAHKSNPNYTFDDLFMFIENYNPDVIGVEIRAEDMDSTVNYLKNNYPSEMYESISKYNNKLVLGFDWLGQDLEGKSIPKNYWKEICYRKKLQREQESDSLMLEKKTVLNTIQKERYAITLNSSIYELNDGRYDSLSTAFYDQLNLIYHDTKYALLSDFYRQRDEHIAQNIIDIIERHPGKKLIFLMGADHRFYSIKTIKQKYGDKVSLDIAFNQH